MTCGKRQMTYVDKTFHYRKLNVKVERSKDDPQPISVELVAILNLWTKQATGHPSISAPYGRY